LLHLRLDLLPLLLPACPHLWWHSLILWRGRRLLRLGLGLLLIALDAALQVAGGGGGLTALGLRLRTR